VSHVSGSALSFQLHHFFDPQLFHDRIFRLGAACFVEVLFRVEHGALPLNAAVFAGAGPTGHTGDGVFLGAIRTDDGLARSVCVQCWPKCEVIQCPLSRRFQGLSGPDADIAPIEAAASSIGGQSPTRGDPFKAMGPQLATLKVLTLKAG
jgi:hypothetical protein